jgi:hypothetical protein
LPGGHISDFHGLPDANTFDPLTSATPTLANYPRTFVAPNGLLFYAGELRQSRYLDPTGAGGWTPVATSLYGRRDYGSAVMYQPGKVMIAGGSDPPDGAPTATAETIDLTAGAAAWRYSAPMAFPRRHLNLTLLPDGRTVATGGPARPASAISRVRCTRRKCGIRTAARGSPGPATR